MNPLEEYPEFDVADWTRLDLDKIPPNRVIGFLELCLRYREFRELMMHQYGSIVLGASKNLLTKAKDLITRLGRLEADMDPDPDKKEPDWAEYKSNQRANNLRDYWERLRKRKDMMREIKKLYSREAATSSVTPSSDPGFISRFVEPFSSRADATREWDGQLDDIMKVGISRLLPWRPIIAQEIASGKTNISDIVPVIEDKKKDTILKFQFLLELANDQKIRLSQEKPFHEVDIHPTSNCERLDSGLTLKDRSGRTYPLDWVELNTGQRKKIIDDLKDGKVMLV